MTNQLGGGATRPRTLLLALLALATLGLIIPGLSAAATRKKSPKVTVMTRNVYLGADLGPAINADSLCGAVDAGGEIIKQVDRTDFPSRAPLLAKEIDKSNADLVGLQEVALWRDQTPSDYSTTPATHVRYDFLDLLQEALKARGVKYKVVVKQNEFDQELPADMDGDDATGSGPAAFCGADIDGRLTMRDVILKRKGSGVKTKNPEKGHFENRYSVLLGGAIPINVDRGWVSVHAKIKKTEKRRGAKFKFVNAHLEAFGDPGIRANQARELIGDSGSSDYAADKGPLQTRKQLIFVGDTNSGGPKDKVGTGFTKPGDEEAHNVLLDFGMFNLGARQTCCYPDSDLDSATIGDYRFDHTVDHIMSKPKLKQLKAEVTGDDPTVTTSSGLVSSDHGGLWSKLKLKKRR